MATRFVAAPKTDGCCSVPHLVAAGNAVALISLTEHVQVFVSAMSTRQPRLTPLGKGLGLGLALTLLHQDCLVLFQKTKSGSRL